jgi:hypothetical protein
LAETSFIWPILSAECVVWDCFWQRCPTFIKNHNSHPFVSKILQTYTVVSFVWVPSHTSIHGNETGWYSRKSCPTMCDHPYTDLRPGIHKLVNGHWQVYWDSFIYNKLYELVTHILHINTYWKVNLTQYVLIVSAHTQSNIFDYNILH